MLHDSTGYQVAGADGRSEWIDRRVPVALRGSGLVLLSAGEGVALGLWAVWAVGVPMLAWAAAIIGGGAGLLLSPLTCWALWHGPVVLGAPLITGATAVAILVVAVF